MRRRPALAAHAHDAALTTASVEMKWSNGWFGAGTFEDKFLGVTASDAGKVSSAVSDETPLRQHAL